MNTEVINYALLGTMVIFVVKERKRIGNLFSVFMYRDKNREIEESIEDIIREKKVSIEEAKDILITNEIIKALRISKKQWVINSDMIINQGDRISFIDKEIGFIQGDFLGLIESEVTGYDDLYVLRNSKNSQIRQVPISYVKEDTINVYKNKKN